MHGHTTPRRVIFILQLYNTASLESTYYLNKIMAINTAWVIKPTPMVMILSISRSTTARMNSKTKPAHINSTISKFGTLSLSPVSKASRVGIVAEWIKTTANQPKVSALTLGKCCSNQVLAKFKNSSNLIIIFCPHKKCVSQIWPLVVCPIAGLGYSLRENKVHFSHWAI